jgi:hypothetical protein
MRERAKTNFGSPTPAIGLDQAEARHDTQRDEQRTSAGSTI